MAISIKFFDRIHLVHVVSEPSTRTLLSRRHHALQILLKGLETHHWGKILMHVRIPSGMSLSLRLLLIGTILLLPFLTGGNEVLGIASASCQVLECFLG